MTYLYEQCGPERFQQLVQALLLETFPHLQCFPIGQRDGGRDGWDRESDTVLQVKFKRTTEKDNADWLIAALAGEVEKVAALAERGAKRYLVATNAAGSGHLGVGRIDKVQTWLDETMPIPASCLWRDDLDRRMDNAAPELLLRYGETLTLQDGLDVAVKIFAQPAFATSQDVLRAFVKKQLDQDSLVKFKQVNLSNELLKLYIDVPIGLGPGAPRRGRPRSDSAFAAQLAGALSDEHLMMFSSDAEQDSWFLRVREPGMYEHLDLGAADLLLNPRAQEALQRVLLQGAPGQGKSTIAQYVCQVHRAHFLEASSIIAQLPPQHQQTYFRLPVKVDLRDFASFAAHQSPFTSDQGPAAAPSLERFLAELISHESGGLTFTPADVLHTVKAFPLLLFFDGLDEVADVAVRGDLLDLINEAVGRWEAFDARVQIVITSRPSTFGRVIDFHKLGYNTLTLRRMGAPAIDSYAHKWIEASGLESSEGDDVLRILEEKLELPHLAELTRNPMQLTILLSLIHQVGHSLPDQRTELYRRYLDLFLIREADKSQAVREYRQVLTSFIGYLAWTLQAAAESQNAAGNISEDGLRAEARLYLEREGRRPEVADELFAGGLERVFVLVQRIEGLYEFEVQPLREYFCAEYLYETALVQPSRGDEPRGDRAQRFEALVANPFWLNVCRFYAGFCARGELGGLVLSLKELMRAPDLATAAHARRVGVALLKDWVLSNVKFAQTELLEAICEESGLITLTQGDLVGEEYPQLDRECGRDLLRDHAFAVLATWPLSVQAGYLCDLIRVNGGAELREEFLAHLDGTVGADRTRILNRMSRADATRSLDGAELWALVTTDSPVRSELVTRCAGVLSAGGPEGPHDSIADALVQGTLDGYVTPSARIASPISRFVELLGELDSYGAGRMTLLFESASEANQPAGSNIPSAVAAFLNEVGSSSTELHVASLQRSIDFLGALERHFPDRWATYALAVLLAGRPTARRGTRAVPLFSWGESLYDRTRAARLQRSGRTWWQSQLSTAAGPTQHMLWAAMVLAWADMKSVVVLAPDLDRVISDLSADQYLHLYRLQSTIVRAGIERADRVHGADWPLEAFSPAVAALIAVGLRDAPAQSRFTPTQQADPCVRHFLHDAEVLAFLRDGPPRTSEADDLRWSRQAHALYNESTSRIVLPRRTLHRIKISLTAAEVIVDDPLSYPSHEVHRAILELRGKLKAANLRTVADKQRWIFV